MRPIARPLSAAGFALVELALALAVVTLVAIWSASRYVEIAHETAARASGAWLFEVRRGVAEMIGAHYDALAEQVPPVNDLGRPLFVRPTAPTVAELRAAGHLPAHFPLQSALGFGAMVTVQVASACPSAGCRLDAVIVSDRPLVVAPDQPDIVASTEILMTLQGWGATVDGVVPHRLRGPNVSLPNPPSPADRPWPVGTVAAWAGLDRNSMLAYLRVGDERDPQFKGNVTIGGKIAAPTVAATHIEADAMQSGRLNTRGDIISGGGLSVAGDLSSGGVVRGRQIDSASDVVAQRTIRGGSLVSAGDVSAGGRLRGDGVDVRGNVIARGAVRGAVVDAEGAITAGSYVVPRGRGSAGASCAPVGALGRDGLGALLMCEAGAWRRASDGFGGAFATNSVFGCRDGRGVSQRNPKTGSCSCPAGYAAVQLYAGFWYATDEWRAGYICVR